MRPDFHLFGPGHLALLAAVPLTAGLLALWARRGGEAAHRIRLVLAVLLAANLAVWYSHEISRGSVRFPDVLPLQLCDVAAWMTLAAAFTVRPLVYELAYYAGIAGSGMALITPDLWEPLLAYSSIRFFLEHGLVVITVLYLAWAGLARPRPGSVWRAFLALNVFAAAVGAFNAVFGTNYMYLRAKPVNPSLLDYLGPWPVYIIAGEALALALFSLLWLPFRERRAPAVRKRAVL
jgi:hypothetical integral membrane protein (TIGR02206 family)